VRRTILCLLACAPARAEDSVSIVGAYYYEYEAENNRVVHPMVEVRKDLPQEAEVSGYFLVDQITSASAAFQGGADQVYQEYRKEEGIALRKRFGRVTPGVSFRRSDEPDYESTGVGLESTFSLRQDTTVIRVLGKLQDDNVFDLGANRDLDATMIGSHLTQVLRRDLQVGAGLEGSLLQGLQANQYRRCAGLQREIHPDERRRLTAVGWGAWHARPTHTTLYGGYFFYDDSWAVRAHAAELRVTQRVVAPLEAEVYWRPYTQTAAFFAGAGTENYCTGDPKLTAFDARFVEGVLRVSLPPFWFLREPRIEGAIGHLAQDNRYQDAVLARLGASFAF
jgi:hypothetical protein